MVIEKPVVSIIMPSYNARDFIHRAIDSALGQSFDDFELLVIDDGSSDETPDFVEERYGAEPRVRILPLAHNVGPGAARNVGLAAARGDWIGLLDADDAWHADRLARLLPLSNHVDAVFDNIMGRDMRTGALTGVLFPVFPEQEMTIEALLMPQAPQTSYDFGYLQPLIRREFLLAHTIRYDERLRSGEDLIFGLTMLLKGARTRTLDWPGYIYTTPVGEQTRQRSAHSHTVPRDEEVCAVITELQELFGSRCTPEAAAAMSARIAHLKRIGPLAKFYYARTLRDYRGMATLAWRERAVRNEIMHKIGARLSRR